jgi:hypothetical protein
LLRRGRQPGSYRQHHQDCDHSNFHFFTFKLTLSFAKVGSTSHADTALDW